MDRTETGKNRDALRSRDLFRPGREIQRLAEDWAALRRNAFLLNQGLSEIEARLVAIEGRSTGDAHAKLALLTQVLRHDLGLAPDHRAVQLASGALAALEQVHQVGDEINGDSPLKILIYHCFSIFCVKWIFNYLKILNNPYVNGDCPL